MRYSAEQLEPRRLLAGLALVKDVNDGTDPSTPTKAVEYNGYAYFLANESTYEVALFRTDGTTTEKIKNLTVQGGSSTSQNADRMRVFNGLIYFTNSTKYFGNMFYQSDGTPDGTHQVVGAVAPSGPTMLVVGDKMFYRANNGTTYLLYYLDSSGPHQVPGVDLGTSPRDYIAYDNQLYFCGRDATNGDELWRTDGITSTMVTNIHATGSSYPASFCVFSGKLYFAANDSTHGEELWRTDGTAAGTVLVEDIDPGFTGSSPSNLFATPTKLYFGASRPSVGKELFVYDGTTTSMVANLRSGNSSSTPRSFTLVGDKVIFACERSFNVLTQYVTQGTAGTTFALSGEGVGGTQCVTVGNSVYFNDDAPQALWKTNGTTGGTVRLGTFSNESMPIQSFSRFGSSLFFAGYDLVHSIEPWMSDGTSAGTRLLKDLSGSTHYAIPKDFTISNGSLYFTADSPTPYGDYASLFVTDGTTSGTRMSASAIGGLYNFPSNLTDVQGRLFFFGKDPTGNGNSRLLCSDYAGALPRVLQSWESPNVPINASARMVNGKLIFAMSEAGIGYTLWQSDGFTAARVKVLSATSAYAPVPPSNFIAAGSQIFFFADSDNNGYQELWRSDGSTSGTWMVTDPNVYYSTSVNSFVQTAVMGSELWFASSSSDAGTSVGRLYRSDGTASGTALISTFWSVPGETNVRAAAIGGQMYFSATGNADPRDGGSDLWVTNGTAEGTHRVMLFPRTPTSLTNVGGRLFFSAAPNDFDVALWSSDGTESGTQLVKDLSLGSGVSKLFAFTEHNGSLYFGRSGAGSFGELWRSDGTAAGTVQFAGQDPGSAGSISSYLDRFFEYNGELYWPGLGDQFGMELRKWDELAPALTSSSDYEPDSKTIKLAFNETLLSAPSAESIHLRDADQNEVLGILPFYDAATRSVTISGFSQLPDGHYRVSIDTGAVSDTFVNTNAAAIKLDFFSLAADANHDRLVDTADFNLLAENFGGSGKTFSQGDFNYDGAVDSVDFVILCGQYGKRLATVNLTSSPSAGVFAEASWEDSDLPDGLL